MMQNAPNANTQIAGHKAPYLQRIGSLSGPIAPGATKLAAPQSNGGNVPQFLFSRSGRVTGFWIAALTASQAVQAKLLFQVWIQTQAMGTQGADVQVDTPVPVLEEMGRYWEFIPFVHDVVANDRPWVFSLTNGNAGSQNVEVWLEFDSHE